MNTIWRKIENDRKKIEKPSYFAKTDLFVIAVFDQIEHDYFRVLVVVCTITMYITLMFPIIICYRYV